MDEDHSDVTCELQRLQSSITSLFKSVLNEKNKFKNEKEKTVASVESLLTELTNLRKENEQLRKTNNDLRSSCENCSELKEKLAIQDRRSKKLEKTLDVLKKFLNEVPYKTLTPSQFFKYLMIQVNDLRVDDNSEKRSVLEENHSLSHRSLSLESNITAKTRDKEPLCCSTVPGINRLSEGDQGYHPTGGSSNNEVPLNVNKNENHSPVPKSNKSEPTKFDIRVREFRTPERDNRTELDFIDSPLSRTNAIVKGEKSPILLGDQRLFLNKQPLTSSPSSLFKRKAIEDTSSPGRGMQKKFLKSPRQNKYMSPAKGSKSRFTSSVKTTNSLEAEMSFSGVRKLKQTQLNLEYYKSKCQDNDEGENERERNLNEKQIDENRFAEDDLIMESPKHSTRYFDEFRKRKSGDECAGSSKSAEVSTAVVDPDETFVSSLYLKESDFVKKDPVKKEESSPRKKQLSPEYNSVPYPYKGTPVRKRSERMKLPGQVCMECNKYYKAILGEIDSKKLQEILDRCSRHRDKHYNVTETPPGYWKPYLTATMDLTGTPPGEDETMVDESGV